MKHVKSACKASAAKKLGNMRKAYKHGGKVYADGGMVDDEQDDAIAPAGKDLGIEGSKAKSRLDKGKTNINIIIAGGGKSPEPAPSVVPPMPPIPGKPPMPPMMPSMGAGAGPMPPMKNGGRMGFKNGGKVKHAAGGGLGRLEKIKAYGLKPAKGHG